MQETGHTAAGTVRGTAAGTHHGVTAGMTRGIIREDGTTLGTEDIGAGMTLGAAGTTTIADGTAAGTLLSMEVQ